MVSKSPGSVVMPRIEYQIGPDDQRCRRAPCRNRKMQAMAGGGGIRARAGRVSFHARRTGSGGCELIKETSAVRLKRVVVLGANGAMGAGSGALFAAGGCEVVLAA